MVFSVITNIGKSKALYAPKQVLIVPVVSKANWMLIVNVEQRLIANKLLKSQMWYITHKQLNCIVKQPIPSDFSSLVQANTTFVVQNTSGAAAQTITFNVNTKMDSTIKTHADKNGQMKIFNIQSWEFENYSKFEEASFTTINQIMKSLAVAG